MMTPLVIMRQMHMRNVNIMLQSSGVCVCCLVELLLY